MAENELCVCVLLCSLVQNIYFFISKFYFMVCFKLRLRYSLREPTLFQFSVLLLLTSSSSSPSSRVRNNCRRMAALTHSLTLTLFLSLSPPVCVECISIIIVVFGLSKQLESLALSLCAVFFLILRQLLHIRLYLFQYLRFSVFSQL